MPEGLFPATGAWYANRTLELLNEAVVDDYGAAFSFVLPWVSAP